MRRSLRRLRFAWRLYREAPWYGWEPAWRWAGLVQHTANELREHAEFERDVLDDIRSLPERAA